MASEEPRSGYTAVGVRSNIKKLNRTGFLALVLTAGCWKQLDNCRAEDLAGLEDKRTEQSSAP